MARRALKLVSLAAASSGFYLYSSKYLDPNDFGAVRVGRAIATTAVITYDYLTSLRSVPYGSQEYAYLKSQVWTDPNGHYHLLSHIPRQGPHQLTKLQETSRLTMAQ
ncbi:Putative aarF domain-containing protein kinase 1 [Chelonia mydas]|uniref:Putative aarF domain-containing protein kinase 1 n=1 Tax=Chelonia mydas TaxID=8469 RepID=M7AV31_CHEMY|nr:Putative aarF domain-containing protein kinase 1 [Chelonia mydas]